MRKIILIIIVFHYFMSVSSQTLQEVTNNGNSTNNSITAHSFNSNATSFSGAALPVSIYQLSGLQINGSVPNSSHNGIIYQSGGGGGAALGFYRGGSYDTGIDFYTNSGYVFTSGNLIHRLRISSDGLVGIGTANPDKKLSVIGDVRWGGDTTDFVFSGNDFLGMYIEGVGGNQGSSPIRFQSSQSGDYTNYSQFFIDPYKGFIFKSLGNGNSNVGIDTDNPTEKLSVNGKIRAKEIKVEAANWPDYVFEEGYQPASLEETEVFIKTNKHLPGIPSAAEVAKEGISLGEMNVLMMKKIEELTLHVIALKKQLDEQMKVSR